MTVTYDALLDWPDAASIDSEAEGLIKQGESFYDAVAEAKGAWDGLSENYEAPEQQQLLRALDPALRNAESATGATALVASAMGGFASALQELEPRRQQLIADAEAFNLKGCPVDKAEHAQQMAEGEQLQQSINTLVEEYRRKIKDCTTHLAGINSEGDYSDPNAPDINGAALGQVPNLGTSIAQSREFMKLKISRALRLWTIIGDTKVMQWLEPQMAAIVAGEDQGVHPYPLTPQDHVIDILEPQGAASPGKLLAEVRNDLQRDIPRPTQTDDGTVGTDGDHGDDQEGVRRRRGEDGGHHIRGHNGRTRPGTRVLRCRCRHDPGGRQSRFRWLFG